MIFVISFLLLCATDHVAYDPWHNLGQALMPTEDSLNAAIATINGTINWTNTFGKDACAWLEARQGAAQVTAASSVHFSASSPNTPDK